MKVKRKRIRFLGRRLGEPDHIVTFYVRPRRPKGYKKGADAG